MQWRHKRGVILIAVLVLAWRCYLSENSIRTLVSKQLKSLQVPLTRLTFLTCSSGKHIEDQMFGQAVRKLQLNSTLDISSVVFSREKCVQLVSDITQCYVGKVNWPISDKVHDFVSASEDKSAGFIYSTAMRVVPQVYQASFLILYTFINDTYFQAWYERLASFRH